MKITSVNNDRIKDLIKLKQKKGRDLTASFLVEGDHLLQELKQSKLQFTTLGLDDTYDIEITDVIASKLSQTKSGSQEFAHVKMPIWDLPKGNRYLLCDGIQDPGNLGTIIRTAYSFGFDAIILSEDCVDTYNDKVIRSSQGAVFHMPTLRMSLLDAIDLLEQMDVSIYATNLNDVAIPLSEVTGEKLAFVLGSEGSGVSAEVLKAISHHVIIEMSRFESLNVAIAAAIITYAFKQ